MALRKVIHHYFILLALLLISSCSSSKLLKDNEYLLSSIDLKSDTKLENTIQLHQQIKQKPNKRWFSLFKVQLGMYCIAGNSEGKIAKFFRKIGEAPVIYNNQMTQATCEDLLIAMKNRGYRNAVITSDSTKEKHKVHICYKIKCGPQTYVKNLSHIAKKDSMQPVLDSVMKNTYLKTGMPLNIDVLRSERQRLIESLTNDGYYNINKEYISFMIDTCKDELSTNVTLVLSEPGTQDSKTAYTRFKIGKINVFENKSQYEAYDSTLYNGITFFHKGKSPYINHHVYNRVIAIQSNNFYSEQDVTKTHSGLNFLPAVSHCFVTPKVNSQKACIDYDIEIYRSKPHGISVALEGTNTAGDLGAATSLTYTHRNLFHGSELFELKLRGAFEAISGLEGYADENYWEYSVEGKLTFPNISLPWARKKNNTINANSEFNILYNTQERPEFHRELLSSGYSFTWKNYKNEKWQHRWDVISLNYMFMPWISSTFRQNYLEGDDPRYGILRYSYENLFIMKTGYNFIYNSRKVGINSTFQTNSWQIKGNIETAGNTLHLLKNIVNAKRDKYGTYQIFNIAYSQYVKFDFDFVKSILLTDYSSLAFHTSLGLAIPYGNSNILPYEKRYFSGGANSVRGWSVRELGPGTYKGKDGRIDFINQTGNFKLDLSLEYRTYLFWKFYGAAFIDAGNIWNTRNYLDQPGGKFEPLKFYRQIAVAYGLGIRINLDYFILRFDGGMKAINPTISSGKEHYPIISPKFTRDFAFHFAVGLPF